MKPADNEAFKENFESNSWSEWDREMLLRKSNNLFHDEEKTLSDSFHFKCRPIDQMQVSKSPRVSQFLRSSKSTSETKEFGPSEDLASYEFVESLQESNNGKNSRFF